MHPWHDVADDEEPETAFRAVIETPAGSRVQYEVDPALGVLRVKRMLYSAVHFPANYGMVPRTLADDGDALDVLVLASEPFAPMSVVRARAIGLLGLVEEGAVRDDKLLAVHADDPTFAEVRSCGGLPRHWRPLLSTFFREYRALEGKEAIIDTWGEVDAALAALRDRRAAYEAKRRGRSVAAR